MAELAEHKRGARPQCQAIIQPGEYAIDIWDGKRCSANSPRGLIKCEGCGAWFCTLSHWHPHLASVPIDHFEKATSLCQ